MIEQVLLNKIDLGSELGCFPVYVERINSQKIARNMHINLPIALGYGATNDVKSVVNHVVRNVLIDEYGWY